MRVEFQGRNVEITGLFRDHVEPRLDTLQRHFDRILSAKLVVSAQRNWRTVEITVDADGLLLRAEERSDDELSAFDRALDAVERQLDRFQKRMRDLHRQRRAAPPEPATEPEPPEDELEAGDLQVARTKTVALKPMSAHEAIMQMDLLGHDFFLYLDDETEHVCLVYHRKEGGYGVLMVE